MNNNTRSNVGQSDSYFEPLPLAYILILLLFYGVVQMVSFHPALSTVFTKSLQCRLCYDVTMGTSSSRFLAWGRC